MFRTRPWAFTKSLLGTLGTTMTGAHFVRPNSEGALTAAVGPSQGALWPKDGVRSMPKEEVHRPGGERSPNSGVRSRCRIVYPL